MSQIKRYIDEMVKKSLEKEKPKKPKDTKQLRLLI